MANFFSKLKDGLKKTRNSWFDTIFGEDRISDEFFDELEESMILADMGVETSTSLVEALRKQIKEEKLKNRGEAREALIDLIAQRVAPEGPFPLEELAGVILIVGVVLTALLPLYSKLLRKINTSVSVEDNGKLDAIDISGEA